MPNGQTHSREVVLRLTAIGQSASVLCFAKHFHRTVLDEFFRSAFRTTFYETVEALQRDLDAWLVHCNAERPHHGYRNLGKRPIDTVNVYLETVRQEA